MASVAQLVRAPVCGTGCRRFESDHSPHFFIYPVDFSNKLLILKNLLPLP